MIKFVLLLYIFNGDGSSPLVAEFDNLFACETAATSFSQKITAKNDKDHDTRTIIWDCKPKG